MSKVLSYKLRTACTILLSYTTDSTGFDKQSYTRLVAYRWLSTFKPGRPFLHSLPLAVIYMEDTGIFIERIDGTSRPIDWIELNQLKKDILWMFDENGGELHNAFVPDYSFSLPYWEYVTLSGDQYFRGEEIHFYREGALITILCMVAEYIDIVGGSQLVFGDNPIDGVLAYVRQFEPINENQTSLKELVISGLSIAASLTKEDIARNEEIEHPELNSFYARLLWVNQTFIQSYYKSKLNSTYA